MQRYLVGKYIRPQNCEFSDIFGPDLTPHVVVALCINGATTGGSVGGSGPPNFLEDPQLLIRFCRGVHRQASRMNLVYNTEEGRKKKFFLLLLQVLSAFNVSYYGLTFGNAKRFLYIKFIL